jgi:DNA-binding transcriptional ArsR family regulator
MDVEVPERPTPPNYFDKRRMNAVRMKETILPEPATEALELTAVLHALSDPIRLQIVTELAPGHEVVCGVFAVPVQGSTRSHHLRILREAGVTRTRAVGTRRLVSLRRDDLEARFPGLLDSVLAAVKTA